MKRIWMPALVVVGVCWWSVVLADLTGAGRQDRAPMSVASPSTPKRVVATPPPPTTVTAPPRIAAPARPEAKLVAELRALERRGRAMPRQNLARCGELMRVAQAEAVALREEAEAHRYMKAGEASIFAATCVSCSRAALDACAEVRELLGR